MPGYHPEKEEQEDNPQRQLIQGEPTEEDELQRKLSEYPGEQGKQEPLTKFGSLRERIKARAEQIGESAGRAARAAVEKTRQKAAQGFRAGKAEAVKGAEKAVYESGRTIGKAPLILAGGAYGAAQRQVSIAKAGYRERRGIVIHMPMTFHQPQGLKAPKVKSVRVQAGKTVKFTIPRRAIPSYWSAKAKRLCRYIARREGIETAKIKTREIAKIAHWKLQ